MSVGKSTPEPEIPADVPFEKALERLEAIVRELEGAEIGLNDSLARYEEGVKLLRFCHEVLRRAERQISLVSGLDPEGNPICTPMDDTSLGLDDKARQRSQRRSSP